MIRIPISPIRFLVFSLGSVVVGSLVTDIDHILPPFHRSWSDNYYFPVILGVCLGIAYLVGSKAIKLFSV